MFKSLFCFKLLLLLCLGAYAQERRLSGTIRDKDGSPLPGVTVIEKGVRNNGTVVQGDGNFALTLKGSSNVVVVSLIGYESRK